MDEHVRQALAESTDSVHLVVPPSSEYLRTARLVAADAAVRAGLDCEEIEDFRIAVDELCHSSCRPPTTSSSSGSCRWTIA